MTRSSDRLARRSPSRRWARRFAALALMATTPLVGSLPIVRSGATSPTVLYAYPKGAGTKCTTTASHCSLTTALGLVHAGTYTINLEVAGPGNPYYGGFSVNSAGTTLTITRGPNIAGLPVLGGGNIVIKQAHVTFSNLVVNTDCHTNSLAAIDVGDGSTGSITVSGVQFTSSCETNDGGAIDVGDNGGTASATITGSSFLGLRAVNGGAIDVGDNGGHGTLTVSSSIFGANHANDGGAIDSGDDKGAGAVTVTGSTFSSNIALNNGGAVDSGDYGGSSTLSVTNSLFASNATTVGDGGAIDNGDSEPYAGQGSNGTAAITGSTFLDNVAFNSGGAIDSGDNGSNYATTERLNIIGSSFTGNRSLTGDGGAIDNGDGLSLNYSAVQIARSSFSKNDSGDWGGAIANADDYGHGTVRILRSLFYENAASGLVYSGGAISNGTYGGTGVVTISYSTFANNGEIDGVSFNDTGGALFNGSFGTTTISRTTFDTGPVVADAIYNKNIIKIAGSIIAGNGAALCQAASTGVLTSYGYNIEQDGARSCGFHLRTDAAGVNPKLGPLAANGGSPHSEMVAKTSKAFEHIPVSASVKMGTTSTVLCANPDRDQRGVPSPKNQRCNSGAVDAQTP